VNLWTNQAVRVGDQPDEMSGQFVSRSGGGAPWTEREMRAER
jgi:hypothetical protein